MQGYAFPCTPINPGETRRPKWARYFGAPDRTDKEVTIVSYHRKQNVMQPAPLGDAVSVISTAVDVTKDPYFNETLCRVQQLAAIENKRAVPNCTSTRPGLAGGVGLRKVMPALRAYVKAEQQPLLYVAAAAGVIGLPMLIGYVLGKGR